MAVPALAAFQTIATVAQTLNDMGHARAHAGNLRSAADSEREAAAIEAAAYERRANKALAKQQAIGAAAGLDTTSGSPLEVWLDSVKEMERERRGLLYSGELRARSLEAEADQTKDQMWGLAIGGIAKSGSILGEAFGNKPKPSLSRSNGAGGFSQYDAFGRKRYSVTGSNSPFKLNY